jgi:hypothetical protein
MYNRGEERRGEERRGYLSYFIFRSLLILKPTY